MYPDGLCLYLQTTLAADGGVRRSWVFRFAQDGRTFDMGLGPTHTVSLGDARVRARELRLQLLDGINPLEAKRTKRAAAKLEAAKAITFREAASQYISSHESEWRNATHRYQWNRTLEHYAFPVIGDLPVADIDLPLILKVLEPHWLAKRETMSRLRGRIEAILSWATVRGFRAGSNPAAWRGNLEHVLAADTRAKSHHRALPWQEMPSFVAELQKRDGTAARCLEFLVLTACRTSEVALARWSEIDLDARTLAIPLNRMKSGREHRVPLCERAIEILRALPREEGNPHCFIGARRGAPLSTKAMLRVTERGGFDTTPHGLRSSFRDWAAERTAYPREIAEACLAHVVPSAVERSYLRGSFWERRIRLMDEWGRFCTSPPAEGEVVPLHRSAADA